jgi:hypothetical protein
MPPKLSQPPNPKSPLYLRLRDRINFALHVASALCISSGILFFNKIWNAGWTWIPFLLALWAAVVLAHGFWVFWWVKYEEI